MPPTCSFHDRLLALADNQKLAATYRKLTKELTLHRRHNLTGVSRWWCSRGSIKQIVKAIASGDADAAGETMFRHVMNSRERTLQNHLQRQAAKPPEARRGSMALTMRRHRQALFAAARRRAVHR